MALSALLLGAAMLYLYWPTLAWLGRQWLGGGVFSNQARDWSHGPIVIVLFAYLMWRRRKVFSTPRPSLAGLALVLASIGGGTWLYLAGFSSRAPYLSAYSLIIASLGVLWLLFGLSVARHLAGAWLLLPLAVPFPATEWGVTPFLARIVAAASAPLASLAGTPVVRDGTFVSVGRYEYVVEPLCSGFNFIMALLALALPLLYLRGASLKALGLSLLWVPVLGLLAKTLLVSTVLVLTPRLGQDAALVMYHRWLGIPFYLAGLGLVGALVSLGGKHTPVVRGWVSGAGRRGTQSADRCSGEALR